MSRGQDPIRDSDAILYGTRPELPKQPQAVSPEEWANFPVHRDTQQLGLSDHPFRDWAYAGVGSNWCGTDSWAVDQGTDSENHFPENLVSPEEASRLTLEEGPSPNISTRMNTGIRASDQTLPCEIKLHIPDTEGDSQARHNPRVEIHYKMEGREFIDQAPTVILQTIIAAAPDDVVWDWRYLPRAGLMAYDKRYGKLQALVVTRALQ